MSQKYAVLGLLNISPMTGYLIKKNLEGPVKKFWPVSFGGLYPALHKLVEENLIEEEKQEDSRGQILYYITEEGKKELATWLKQKNTKVQCKDEFMLKMLLSKDLSDEERLEILIDYLHSKKQLLNEIEMFLSNEDAYIDKGINTVAKYSQLSLKHEIELLEELIKEEKNV